MLTFLNRLPGPALTRTDVVQRLRALWEEPWANYPNEELKAGCLALYELEKAQGTELPAIVGAIQEHIELEEERLRREQAENYQRHSEAERLRRQQRFLSGADCGWTPIKEFDDLYCRRNGRAFRIARDQDKRCSVMRSIQPCDTLAHIGGGVWQGKAESIAQSTPPRLREKRQFPFQHGCLLPGFRAFNICLEQFS